MLGTLRKLNLKFVPIMNILVYIFFSLQENLFMLNRRDKNLYNFTFYFLNLILTLSLLF